MAALTVNKSEIVGRTALLVAGMAVISGLLAVVLGIRFVGRPLEQLIAKGRRMAGGDLAGPVHVHTHDELQELAEDLNAMCAKVSESQQKLREETAARIAALEQLRHADRLKTVGRLASGIAHELGTPLNVVAGRAGLIASGKLDAAEISQSAAAIRAEADKMTSIIRQLLDFARSGTPRKQPADLGSVVRQTIDLLGAIAEKQKVRLQFQPQTEATVAEIDAGQIQQVLTNLTMNAIQAMPQGGGVEFHIDRRTCRHPDNGGGAPARQGRASFFAIEVQDHGIGISEENLSQLFEPFFTTKEVGAGHRPGTLHCLRHRAGARRLDRSGQPGRRGEPLHRLSSGKGPAMKPRIMIVDDERGMRELLETDLRLRDFAPRGFASAAEAYEVFCREDFDVVLTDLRMPGMDGLEFCRRLVSSRPDMPVIVMTAFGNLESAIAAIRAGAYDFVTKPIAMELLELILRRAVERRQLQQQIHSLRETLLQAGRFDELLGQSPAMLKLYDQLAQIADSDAAVLITGESGTGKELVAKALHRRSRRGEKPFVAVNCAALPDTLLESELFGHVKGAFTDARTDRRGLFLQAEGGTLFLDEIGEMPLAMQAKLLRALEEGTVRPVGSEKEIACDARVLAATNRDLETAVEEGRFRKDLYFRINVIQIDLPPLRARGADALLLAQYFIETFAAQAKKQVQGLSEGMGEKLLAYAWPGNVRELRNVIERAVALTRFDRLTLDDLPEKVRDYRSSQVVIAGSDPAELVSLEEVERRYILHVLNSVQGNRTLAARSLGLDRKTLYRKLRQYGVMSEEG